MANKELKIKHKCIVCGMKINKPKEKYVRLTDFDGKNQTGECFYHLQCWQDKFKIQQQRAMKEMVEPVMGQLLNQLRMVQSC